jgi:phosphatidylglycerol:prolipoprotein diacylglycerol transferase
MIPYFYFPEIPFWPAPIQVWGLLVAIGIMTATIVGARIAKRQGLEAAGFVDLAAWAAIAGVAGARIGYLLFYGGGAVFSLQALRIWEGGMSMLGGVLGGAAAVWFLRGRLRPIWGYLEIAAFVYPLGEAIGRLGCFMIHDHPGIPANFFLAVNISGTPRLDLGLLLSLSFGALFALFVYLRRFRVKGQALFIPALLIGWGVIRFSLDFLREWGTQAADYRLYWFTPAQIASVAFIGLGVYLLVKKPIKIS